MPPYSCRQVLRHSSNKLRTFTLSPWEARRQQTPSWFLFLLPRLWVPKLSHMQRFPRRCWPPEDSHTLHNQQRLCYQCSRQSQMAAVAREVMAVTARQMYGIQVASLQDNTRRATSVSWDRQRAPWLPREGFTKSHNLQSVTVTSD